MAIFTGAGLSTAAGIPDYRSPPETENPVGVGHWEKKARIDAAKAAGVKVKEVPKRDFNVRITEAKPTKAHMALVELADRGILKHVISQNVDGLHMRSGITTNKLTELHGNCFTEICSVCKTYNICTKRSDTGKKNHKNGNLCKACGGEMEDTIVWFGESL